jgi:DNA/RNA endonuclease YhcR with UshA esterase domain
MMRTAIRRRVGRAPAGALLALAALALGGCDPEMVAPFEVQGQGDLAGTLYFDADRDGVYDPFAGDMALSGVDVALRVRGTEQVISGAEDTTDGNGRFVLENVPVGTHDLYVAVPESLASVCQNPLPVSIFIGETTNVRVAGQESCLIDIADARELPGGEPVTVRGTVTVAKGTISSAYFWIHDGTAGIKIYAPAAPAVQRGDVIEATGLTEIAFGEFEVNASTGTVTVLGTGPVPDPVVITGAELVSHDYQGSLVTVEGLTVTTVADHSAGSSYNVTVSAPDGSSFVLRIDSDAGITTEFGVGSVYDVTGVVSPFGGAEQLYPRSDADIVPAG